MFQLHEASWDPRNPTHYRGLRGSLLHLVVATGLQIHTYKFQTSLSNVACQPGTHVQGIWSLPRKGYTVLVHVFAKA